MKNQKLFEKRTQRLKREVELNVHPFLIMRECELILKAYFGSIFRYFLWYIKNKFKYWYIYLTTYSGNRKEIKSYFEGVEWTENVIKKLKNDNENS